MECLNPEQLAQFQTAGYLVIPNYLDQATCSALLSNINSLLQNFPLETHPMTRFSTGESSAHVGDEYFLTSGDKVRFFFEEGAFSTEPSTSQDPTPMLVKPKEKAINKIGHALHAHLPAFAAISHMGLIGRLNAKIASQLGFNDPRLLQSMVICKQPEIGGAVPSHQDSTFLYTMRPSAVGVWIALEDATEENGCLSFAVGSHRFEPVRQRFVRNGNNGGTTFEEIPLQEHKANDGDDKDGEAGWWPRGSQREEPPAALAKRQQEYKQEPVKAGTMVLIHGNVLHKSEKNLSSKGRMIYTFHMIEGEEEYDEKNWLQIPGGAKAFTKLDGLQ